MLKEDWLSSFSGSQSFLIVSDKWSGGKSVGGKKKEDKIIPGCYVDLLLIVAFFFFKSPWQPTELLFVSSREQNIRLSTWLRKSCVKQRHRLFDHCIFPCGLYNSVSRCHECFPYLYYVDVPCSCTDTLHSAITLWLRSDIIRLLFVLQIS